MEPLQRQLEERIAFCERYIDSLNEVIVDMQKRLQLLELQGVRMKDDLARLEDQQREPFDPGVDKPPHY